MQVGLSDLKHVGFLMTFSRFQLYMKSFKCEFSSPRLKSPTTKHVENTEAERRNDVVDGTLTLL